jgi:cytochrome c oxidase assembly protein subunit 15
MVSSGLAGSARVSVSQYRLAFHLTLACLIYVAILWTARGLSPRPVANVAARLRMSALAIVVLVLLQIYLGALVAGVDAGRSFNTWPLIDGAFIPSAARLWFETPWWRNLFENVMTVQFDHRMLAYTIWVLALLHAEDAWRTTAFRPALAVAVLVTAQAALGIVTLLHVAPLGLSLAHQMLAVVVLTAAVLHAEALHRRVGTQAAMRAFPAEQARAR